MFRYVFNGKGIINDSGITLFSKEDFNLFNLPENWDKIIYTDKGERRQIDFPVLWHNREWYANKNSSLASVNPGGGNRFSGFIETSFKMVKETMFVLIVNSQMHRGCQLNF
jgi:hypothetical protein